MGKGGSITEGSRHQPIRSQLVEKLEEEEGEEVWRSNLFVMIYIKTEWGGREKREESQNTMEVVIEVGRPHEGGGGGGGRVCSSGID